MSKKILVVDDEKIARDRMVRFLNTYHEKLDINEAANGPEAIRAIQDNKPDVVFLDIQMPEMSGFDVLHHLQDRNFQVIFQTAFDEFAIKAFEVNACDYLLKPYPEEKLHAALQKALSAQSQHAKLIQLEQHLKKSETFLKTLITKKGTQTRIINLDDVDYFKSEDHYTFAVVGNSEHIVDLSLNLLEEKLDPDTFVRCHRNCIVKKLLIDRIGGTDDSTLLLKTGVQLPISRENRKKLLKQICGK